MISFVHRMMIVFIVIVVVADSALAWQLTVHHANVVSITAIVIVMTVIALGVSLWFQMQRTKINKGNRE